MFKQPCTQSPVPLSSMYTFNQITCQRTIHQMLTRYRVQAILIQNCFSSTRADTRTPQIAIKLNQEDPSWVPCLLRLDYNVFICIPETIFIATEARPGCCGWFILLQKLLIYVRTIALVPLLSEQQLLPPPKAHVCDLFSAALSVFTSRQPGAIIPKDKALTNATRPSTLGALCLSMIFFRSDLNHK